MSKEISKGRPDDESRIMRLLRETGGLSNASVRGELKLTESRYLQVRDSLLSEGLVEKFRCRGGGIRLTPKGDKKAASTVSTPKPAPRKERELYDPLVEVLTKLAKENESSSMAMNTAKLRQRGQWQNPDVTQVTVEHYNFLKKKEVIISTFEVKPWQTWSVQAVFEAASHRRFAHEASVVIECAGDDDEPASSKLESVANECGRLGVGLYLLKSSGGIYQLKVQVDPAWHAPSDADAESWLSYIFNRNPGDQRVFNELWERESDKD